MATVPWRYDYVERLKPWREAFGASALRVKVYDPISFRGGSIVSDFCDLIGLGLSPLKPPATPLNKSLDLRSLEFLRLWNVTRAESRRMPKTRRLRRTLVSILERQSDGARPAIPIAFKRQIERTCEASNRQIAQDFELPVLATQSNNAAAVGSTEKATEEASILDYMMTSDVFAEIFSRVWCEMNEPKPNR